MRLKQCLPREVTKAVASMSVWAAGSWWNALSTSATEKYIWRAYSIQVVADVGHRPNLSNNMAVEGVTIVNTKTRQLTRLLY